MKITTEIKKEWAKIEDFTNDKFSTDLSTFYKDLDILDKESTKTARKHFQPRLGILEQGIHWMGVLYLSYEDALKKGEDKHTLQNLCGAICAHAVGIRRLCLNGLDAPARVVLRSLIEPTQYFLVLLHDPVLLEMYNKHSETDEAYKFWKNNLSRKRIKSLLKQIEDEFHERKQSPNEIRDYFQNIREDIYKWTSEFVHISPVAAAFSPMAHSIEDNLVFPNLFGGKANRWSVATLHHTNETIYYFSALASHLHFFRRKNEQPVLKTDMSNEIDIIAYWGPAVFRQLFGRHISKKDKYMSEVFKEFEDEDLNLK
jgi:Family of unknown function (DUF5677)